MENIITMLSKRIAIKLIATIFFLHLTGLAALAQTEIGVQLYTFRKQLPADVPGTLSLISRMGFHELEGGGTYGLSIDSFKNLLQQNNLTVVSVGVDYAELQKNPQPAIDRAKAFGAKYIVCFWIPHNGNEFTIKDAENAATLFNAAGKMMKANGISFCYHPHGYEFRPYKGGTLFDQMVKIMEPANANFEMDVFWVKHPGQDPVALLKKYPGRFPLMHLKDRKPGTIGNQNGQADEESNVALGDGDVGIAAIMKQAKLSGVKHYFIEDESSIPLVQVPKSILFLQRL